MQRIDVRHRVLVEDLWPQAGAGREAVLILVGVVLLSLSAQVRIQLPFSPVPITGQTFGVLLISALYGSRRAPAAVLSYLAIGGLGLPVFAGGGAGVTTLLGPTAGYLIGFPMAAFVVGTLSEKGWDRHHLSAAISMVLGNVLIYVAGVLWLARFTGWDNVLAIGVVPFLIGDAIKIALAMLILPTGWRVLGSKELTPGH